MQNKTNLILGVQGIMILWLAVLSYKVFLAPGVSSSSLQEAREAAAAAAKPIAPGEFNLNNPNNPNNNQPPAPKKDPSTFTSMKFDNNIFDFGTIKEGDKASHVFKFKNTGDKPLIIENAFGSCGCTVPKFPREPIMPGASGEISVEFNSEGKPGMQEKFVTVQANMAEDIRLTVKGQVQPGNSTLPAATGGGK